MGWWQDKHDGRKVLIGDDTLDLTGDYLREFSRVFKKEMKRRPTLAELLRHIDLGLSGCGYDVFDDLERVEVTGISVSTKRRPKRHKYCVGTVFRVPVMKGKVGYGRVVFDSKQMGALGVFFGPVDASTPWHAALQEQPAFYIHFADQALVEGKWQIVGFLPMQSDEALPLFVMGDHSVVVRGDDYIRRATAEDVEKYPAQGLFPEGSIVRIFKDLATGLIQAPVNPWYKTKLLRPPKQP